MSTGHLKGITLQNTYDSCEHPAFKASVEDSTDSVPGWCRWTPAKNV